MTSLRSTTQKTLLSCALIALLAQSALAHTYLSSVYLDGVALDEGDCVRPHPSTAFDSPIPLVTQADMTCGWLPYANTAANRKCPIAAGSTIGIQWHHNSDAATDDIVEASHKGPIMFYLSKTDSGSGSSWFKIYEDGYSNTDQMWAVDKLIAADGRVDVTLPSDIAPGNYLLRGEVIALHNGYALNGAQPYVGCVELTISGSGSATPATVSLPGAYSPTDPGMLFNIYQPFTSYPIPGPSVYSSSSASVPPTTAPVTPTTAPAGPTSAPPTNYPTYAPPTAPTTVPTSAPTSAPTSSPIGGTVKVQMNSGSNVWWFAVAVSGGSAATVKVELMDSGSVSSFVPLGQASYGFYFSQSIQLTLPITLRLTSSEGQQIILENFITSWTQTSQVDSMEDYGSSTAPTSSPTVTPTAAPPSSGTVQFTLHNSTSMWWLAVAVRGIDENQIDSVSLKENNIFNSFTSLSATNWGFWILQTHGLPLNPPFTIKVEAKSGAMASVVVPLAPGQTFDTGVSL